MVDTCLLLISFHFDCYLSLMTYLCHFVDLLIKNPQIDQFPVSLLAQLAEHYSDITEVIGLTPTQTLIFATSQVVSITAMIAYIFMITLPFNYW